MNLRGLGDRWLQGERIAGIAFGPADHVHVREGKHAGRGGRILLLMAGPPDPLYLLDLDDEAGPARVRQSALAPPDPRGALR
jgi:hypothetical protein